MNAKPLSLPADVEPVARPEESWFTAGRIEVLIWVFVGLGLIARLLRYGLSFPLWEDEAFLAYNLSHRGFAELLRPLDYIQVAPIGYLWTQRAVIEVFGFSEYSLRATALVAGIASLFLMRRVAKLTLLPREQLCAVAFFAVSYPMIRYSAEAKQYGLDLFLGLTLVWLFLEMRLRLPSSSRVRWVLGLFLVAAFGPFVSHPLVFLGGGVSIAWAWCLRSSWREGRFGNVLAWLVFNILLAASFAAHYWLARQALSASNDALMQQFWGQNFPPLSEPLRFPLWLLKTLTGDFLAFPVGGGNAGSTLTFLLVAGGIVLWAKQKRGDLLLLVLVPLGLHFLAAAVHKFPMGGHVKFSMYWAPLGALLMGTALARVWEWLDRRPGRVPVWSLAGLMILALLACGSVVRDVLRPAKNPSDMQGRNFARWLWNDLAQESEVVCLHEDLHKDFTAELLERLNWSASFYCNSRIYSPRLKRGMPPEWSRVSADRPLRVVSYRPDGFAHDEVAEAAWLREMEGKYRLVTRDRYPVPRFKQNGRTLVCMDHVDMFVFVPKP